MDDAVNQRPVPTPIPILSPALHCIAMTAIVYLRTSFGYVFLRPKSIFFAFSWVFVLAFIVAWNEPAIWSEYHTAAAFGAGAVALYWLHFSFTFFREWRQTAEPDQYPGTSYITMLLRLLGLTPPSAEFLHFWLEPCLVLLVSITLRFAFAERHLSAWLIFVAVCMFGREAINYWTSIRKEKGVVETIRKVQQQSETLSDDRPVAAPPKATRTEPVKMKRNTAHAEEAAREERFAKLLRILAPYSLHKAEENYKALVQLEHPDANENSPESNAATAELNDAIAFFRDRLRD
ncbi:MAG: hypothetical protein QOE70_193 [Chthoniobacter sp.]|jgi:hypothetical protein|nr:hypothetical protein [Chthoniobacter sp.]